MEFQNIKLNLLIPPLDIHGRQWQFLFLESPVHFLCLMEIVSGYVCNHGSPNGERDTASPRGRYGERPQRDSV